MPNTDKLIEGFKEILTEDLVMHNVTHEHPPPGKDCYEDCGVAYESGHPILAPMRSGGEKHKKCMDCWGGYIDGLAKQLAQCLKDHKGVLRVKKDIPDNEVWCKVEREFEAYCAGQNDMTNAGFTSAIEELEIHKVCEGD